MSKLGSKEEILSAIQSHFENIQSGNLTADGMESLVELTRELHERTLILRYKSYEEKVFGPASTGSAGVDETGSAGVDETGSRVDGTSSVGVHGASTDVNVGTELNEDVTADAEPVEAQHSIGFEEVEAAILAAEPSIQVDEPVFDFDMFEKAEAAIEPAIEPTQEKPADAQQSIENEMQNTFTPAAETKETETPAMQQSIEMPATEAQQIANEVEESPVTVSEQMPVSTPQPTAPAPPAEPAQPIEKRQTEIPLPEELAIMNEPVIIPEKAPEVRQPEENDMFKRFNSNSDDTLSSKFSATKLHTLAGAFGLNEKLQCIRELFKGSSEAFNQAIETLDQQENFTAAKRVLAQYAQQNSWNLESNLTAEFIQKVERRFL